MPDLRPATCHRPGSLHLPLPHLPRRTRQATMTVPSAHASRPTAGRRKPTGAKTAPPQRGFVLLLLPESTCECAVCLFLPSLADCAACKQGHPPATHGRKAVRAASLQCFVFFPSCPPPPRFTGSSKSRSSGWRPGKTPFGLSFFVVGVSDEDRKRVHRIGAAVPAVLAFFRLFVEASYLAAPPARVKDAPLDVFLSLSSCFFLFPLLHLWHSLDRVKKKMCG